MCCKGFLKMMMFIVNGAIFLSGAAILAVGVWVKVDSSSLLGLLDSVEGVPPAVSQLVNVSYLLIGVGAVLLVLGFLGCCGAIKESRCMLLTFFCIVLIIFLAEVAGAVVLFVFKDLAGELIGGLEDEVRKSIKNDYGKKEGLTELWNATMKEFQCCGFNNFTDFSGSPFNDGSGNIYPQYCCNKTITVFPCTEFYATESQIEGCYNKLLQAIEENALIIAGVAVGIAAIEIAAMVVSMILYKQIGTKA